jgi:hypothetical protein
LAEPARAPAPADLVATIAANLARVVHAPAETLRLVVLCLVAEGHLIIEDFPGVGKTMLAKALARSLDCRFSRMQFTPDLLPSDVTGVNVFDQRTNEFEFRPGPVFANLLLVDEVNRASPKTQAALLECMQESQVTVDGVTYPLERPFMAIATQNPIEYEGTYPLPEAQLDRFTMRLALGYPTLAEEAKMLDEQTHEPPLESLDAVAGAAAREGASARRRPRLPRARRREGGRRGRALAPPDPRAGGALGGARRRGDRRRGAREDARPRLVEAPAGSAGLWRLQTGAILRPRSRPYNTGTNAPCVLVSLGFRAPETRPSHGRLH